MANLQDSKAHFRARAAEYGVPDPFVQSLVTNGISTMAHLAFAIGRPGQEITDADFDTFITAVHGAALTIGGAAAMRRLHFEAEIILTASLKASIEQPASDSSTPRPTPIAERSARMTQLKTELAGVLIEGIGEPSHALVDECNHQYETRTLRYIEPSRCHSRETEVVTVKNDKVLKINANTLSVKETKTLPDESVTTAYQLAQCFKRRAIAYDFANLISFTAHERYTESLLHHLSMDPPPNFQHTTIDQILRADREVWLFLSRNVENIRPAAGGPKPLDDQLALALKDYKTSFHLIPLPRDNSYGPVRTVLSASSQYDDPPKGGKGKKGKGKSKSAGSSAAPRGYIGCVGKDAKNRSICFDWNIGECSHAAAGAACRKGRHVCFKAGCFKPHQYHKAHAEEAKQRKE